GAHAMFKASLFLVVGVVDAAAGTRDLRRLTGVGRALPWTAVAGGLATASMIGLPPSAGYVAKQAGLESLLHGEGPGWVDTVVLWSVVVGSMFTVAYGLRFWWGAFASKPHLGAPPARANAHQDLRAVVARRPVVEAEEPPIDPARIHRQPFLLVGPAVVLAVLGLATALVPHFGEELLAPYADTYPVGEPGHLVLWAGLTPALALTVLVLVVGVALFWQRARVERFQ